MKFSVVFENLELLIKMHELQISNQNMRNLATLIYNNSHSNSSLHVGRIFFYNKKIISITQFWHYMELNKRYPDLRIVDNLRYLDHAIFIKSSSNGVFSCMFTSKATSPYQGILNKDNILLVDNIFYYATPFLYCDSFTFYNTFMIFHGVNKLPSEITLNHDLKTIANYSIKGFKNSFRSNEYLTFLPGQTSFQRLPINEISILELTNMQNYLENENDLDRDIERVLVSFNTHVYYDYASLRVTNDFRRLLPNSYI